MMARDVRDETRRERHGEEEERRGRDKNGDAERGLKLARRREAGAGGKGEEPAGEILEEINTGCGARAPTVERVSADRSLAYRA